MIEAAECAICAMVAAEPSDGWAYENDSWVAGVLPGLEIPGWIVLALRRHAVGAAPLTDQESADLGLALAPLTRALASVTSAERMYLQSYGEMEPHWHLLLSTRGPEVPPEHRHVQFFLNRDRYVDTVGARRVIDRLRVELALALGRVSVSASE